MCKYNGHTLLLLRVSRENHKITEASGFSASLTPFSTLQNYVLSLMLQKTCPSSLLSTNTFT